MPVAIVHFVGEDDIILDQEYDSVKAELQASDSGEFTRQFGSEHPRVVIYKSAVAYIQEAAPST
jgi:hypothetical protein